jgi:hypothetical protein
VSDWVDRIVAEAMGRAEQVWDEEAELGRLVWALADGQRCYVDGGQVDVGVPRKENAHAARFGCTSGACGAPKLTWVFPDGHRLVSEFSGFDVAALL